jgi:signal transduction histidine kinase
MRRRLALLVAAAMSLVLIAFLVPLALLLREVAADRAVTAATATAQSLTSLVATSDKRALQPAVDQLNTTAGRPVTVFLPDGTSLGAPATRSPAVQLAALQGSITVADANGREILVAVQGLPQGNAVVRAFVDQADLSRGVRSAWLVLILLGILLLTLGVVVADWLARTIVRPVGELAAVSHKLASGDLDARARPGGPTEVRAVASALNHLAARIRDLVLQEREAIADVSHRLRTPLTALRLDAESLRHPDDAERISAHADTLEREVTALIEEARNHDAGPKACDAAEVVAERAAFWSVLAQDQSRRMTVETVSGPLPVAVGKSELAACLDALLGNVFAHTPEGTPYKVKLAPRPGGGAHLVVEDTGPGFRDAAVGPRGTSGAGSTGLGLDIARQTAESSGGSFTATQNHPHGAKITLDLGPPGLAAR